MFWKVIPLEQIFRRKQEVHFYDCDPQSRMKVSAANKLLADMADAHYAARGMDHRWLWEHGFVFLVSKVSIRFDRLPRPREILTADTWERGVKGASFLRDFEIRDEQENRVMTASTTWMLVNPESWQVLRPSEFPNARPTGIEADCSQCRRLKMAEGVPAGERPVRYSDLDANGHIYNAVYADIAVDALPEKFQRMPLFTYQINFIHQAVLGDTISLWMQQINDYTVVIKGVVGDHDCFLCEFGYRPSEGE